MQLRKIVWTIFLIFGTHPAIGDAESNPLIDIFCSERAYWNSQTQKLASDDAHWSELGLRLEIGRKRINLSTSQDPRDWEKCQQQFSSRFEFGEFILLAMHRNETAHSNDSNIPSELGAFDVRRYSYYQKLWNDFLEELRGQVLQAEGSLASNL